MLHYSERPAPLGIRIAMPESHCANCGLRTEVKPYAVVFRRSRGWLLSGVEWKIGIPVPACPACAPTLMRRRRSALDRAMWGATFGAIAAMPVLVVLLRAGYDMDLVALFVALAMSAAIGVAWRPQRPRGLQTSAYQPVRLLDARQDLMGGTVRFLRLGFTSETFRGEFSAVNRQQLSAGTLAAVRIDGT